VEPVGGSKLSARQWQSWMKLNQRQRIADDLVDRVRGATEFALKDWKNGEAPFWELVAAVDRLFPGIKPVPHPTDVEAANHLDYHKRRGLE
jgi:hypothetical protein